MKCDVQRVLHFSTSWQLFCAFDKVGWLHLVAALHNLIKIDFKCIDFRLFTHSGENINDKEAGLKISPLQF